MPTACADLVSYTQPETDRRELPDPIVTRERSVPDVLIAFMIFQQMIYQESA